MTRGIRVLWFSTEAKFSAGVFWRPQFSGVAANEPPALTNVEKGE
jgi:uncharacterized protein YegJ (DUF2314 family)